MPWIRTVPAEEASGVLRELFERFKIERGRMFTPYEVLEGNMLDRARRFGLPLHPGTYEHLEAAT